MTVAAPQGRERAAAPPLHGDLLRPALHGPLSPRRRRRRRARREARRPCRSASGEICREGKDLFLLAYGSMVPVGRRRPRCWPSAGSMRGRQRPLRQAAGPGAAAPDARSWRRAILTLEEHLTIGRIRQRACWRRSTARAGTPRGCASTAFRTSSSSTARGGPAGELQARSSAGVVETVLALYPELAHLARPKGAGAARRARREARGDGDVVTEASPPASRAIEKLLVAGLRGFCAGVVRAIDVVERALEVCDGPGLRPQGDHPQPLRRGRAARARGPVFVEEVNEVPDGSWLIYSAHGISPDVRENARRKRLRTIDATCPLVTKVHLEAIHYARQKLHDHPDRPRGPRRDDRHARRGARTRSAWSGRRRRPRPWRCPIPTGWPT